jgi:PPM family protein phosphatase
VTGTKTCPTCNETNLLHSNFCENCGALISLEESVIAGIGRQEQEEMGSTDSAGENQSAELPDADTVAEQTEGAASAEPHTTQRASSSDTIVLRTRDGKPRGNARPAAIKTHEVGYRSDVGLSRSINQDAGGAWTWTRPDGSPASLLVVADGVSAGRHSEEASKLTVDLIFERLAPLISETTSNLEALAENLKDAAKLANQEITKRVYHSLSTADSTTLVTVVCLGGEGGGVWCGDSRVYRLTPHGAVQLTIDHSWAEQAVKAGLLNVEEASRDPRAHMITRWLGPPAKEDPGIEEFRFTLQPGDAVMCCTDGLYGYFVPPASNEEDDIARMLSGDLDGLDTRVSRLVDIALERGGRDNITVAVLGVDTLKAETQHEEQDAEETTRLKFPGT